jgi:hypothetical protein
MDINFGSLFIKIKIFLTIIFEKMTLRTKPDYEKVNDNDDSIVYFDNPIRNKFI